MKTFILDGIADYTSATLVITYESIEKFIEDFKAYHKRKLNFLGNCNYYRRINIDNPEKWWKDIEEKNELEKKFTKSEVICFEISTGSQYIKQGHGSGNFYDNLIIIREKDDSINSYWLIVNEFNSDLPKGINYYADYCA